MKQEIPDPVIYIPPVTYPHPNSYKNKNAPPEDLPVYGFKEAVKEFGSSRLFIIGLIIYTVSAVLRVIVTVGVIKEMDGKLYYFKRIISLDNAVLSLDIFVCVGLWLIFIQRSSKNYKKDGFIFITAVFALNTAWRIKAAMFVLGYTVQEYIDFFKRPTSDWLYDLGMALFASFLSAVPIIAVLYGLSVILFLLPVIKNKPPAKISSFMTVTVFVYMGFNIASTVLFAIIFVTLNLSPLIYGLSGVFNTAAIFILNIVFIKFRSKYNQIRKIPRTVPDGVQPRRMN